MSWFTDSAEWYDRSINWEARLGRELPLLHETFGPPGVLGLCDAGCGTGRHAAALGDAGYTVTAIDADADMLRVAESRVGTAGGRVRLVHAAYERLPSTAPGPFDGLYCLGNALAAAGSADAVRTALRNFSQILRIDGRLLMQVLNFPPLRQAAINAPCIRGPRVSQVDGVEYVSTRHFHFERDAVRVTNVTLWHDGPWRYHAHAGVLFPIEPATLQQCMGDAGLRVDTLYGDYDRNPFDPVASPDLIVVATRRP